MTTNSVAETDSCHYGAGGREAGPGLTGCSRGSTAVSFPQALGQNRVPADAGRGQPSVARGCRSDVRLLPAQAARPARRLEAASLLGYGASESSEGGWSPSDHSARPEPRT